MAFHNPVGRNSGKAIIETVAPVMFSPKKANSGSALMAPAIPTRVPLAPVMPSAENARA